MSWKAFSRAWQQDIGRARHGLLEIGQRYSSRALAARSCFGCSDIADYDSRKRDRDTEKKGTVIAFLEASNTGGNDGIGNAQAALTIDLGGGGGAFRTRHSQLQTACCRHYSTGRFDPGEPARNKRRRPLIAP